MTWGVKAPEATEKIIGITRGLGPPPLIPTGNPELYTLFKKYHYEANPTYNIAIHTFMNEVVQSYASYPSVNSLNLTARTPHFSDI